MQRYSYYYKQPVTPKELNDSFAAAEEAIQSLAVGMGLRGLALKGEVVERAPLSGFGATLLGPMIAYDDAGQRIFAPTQYVDIDLSIDENSAATPLSTPGQERYLSIFAKFQREFSDARRDGNDQDIFYSQAESYQLLVAAGAPAPTGAASRPSLRAGAVLLADVKLSTGQTEVRNEHILTDRTQFMFRVADGDVQIQARSLQEMAQNLVMRMNQVLAGLTAATLSFSPTDDIDATDVQAAVVELRAQMVENGSALSAAGVPFAPTGTLSSTNVQAAVVEASSEALAAASAAQSTASAADAYARNLHNEPDYLNKRYDFLPGAYHHLRAGYVENSFGVMGEVMYTNALGEPERRAVTEFLPLSSGVTYTHKRDYAGGGVSIPLAQLHYQSGSWNTVWDQYVEVNLDLPLPVRRGARFLAAGVGVWNRSGEGTATAKLRLQQRGQAPFSTEALYEFNVLVGEDTTVSPMVTAIAPVVGGPLDLETAVTAYNLNCEIKQGSPHPLFLQIVYAWIMYDVPGPR